MNSVVKLLLYKRYEDRISKLKILSLTWFVIFLCVFSIKLFSFGRFVWWIDDDGSFLFSRIDTGYIVFLR